mgnify:CR=1 FL=1
MMEKKRQNPAEFWQKTPIHLAILIIAFTWTLPTVGLLISSLRRRDAMLETGWWTILQHPFDLTQYHLGNYLDVIQSQGMGQAFFNSLTMSSPASVIPIAMASFAG